jgi:glutamate/tyrosine decarboxylase-like PLP-dependent enzyme
MTSKLSDRAGVDETDAPGTLLELNEDEMRSLGHHTIELLIERWTGLRSGPAWTGSTRDEMEQRLREPPPEQGSPPDEVFVRAVRDVLGHGGRLDHPRFLAFIPSSPTWVSVMADALAGGFNNFGGTWLGSPGTAQLELVVTDWFREWLGFPDTGGGVLTSGGSAASLDAFVAAREAAGNPAAPVVYIGDQGHSSLDRAARIAGMGGDAVRHIASDDQFRMDPVALSEALAEDREAGRTPVVVCASAGATNTGVVDPLRAIGEVCRRHGVWYHIDGAYGGFAVLTEEGREALDGIETADSVTLDPHKWLFQPYEVGCLMVRDTRRLHEAFHILPEYLQDVALGQEHVNFADRGLQLTRRTHAVKIWASIQAHGLGAFREAIREGMALTRRSQDYLESSEDHEVLCPAGLGVVCFRFRPQHSGLDSAALEALNTRIQDRIIQDGFAMMSSTRLRGEYALRMCILNYRTTWGDVEATLDRIRSLGHELMTS